MITSDIQAGIDKIIEIANADYEQFMPPSKSEITARMNEEFKASWDVRPGQKYIKLVSKSSVWGFIVNTDTDKTFKRGDILKAACFNAPARNFRRGNVLEGDFSGVRWTSAL